MASAKEFVQSPSMEVLETFKKDMLIQIAQELQLELKRSTPGLGRILSKVFKYEYEYF